jgi:hypothetical protein
MAVMRCGAVWAITEYIRSGQKALLSQTRVSRDQGQVRIKIGQG